MKGNLKPERGKATVSIIGRMGTGMKGNGRTESETEWVCFTEKTEQLALKSG